MRIKFLILITVLSNLAINNLFGLRIFNGLNEDIVYVIYNPKSKKADENGLEYRKLAQNQYSDNVENSLVFLIFIGNKLFKIDLFKIGPFRKLLIDLYSRPSFDYYKNPELFGLVWTDNLKSEYALLKSQLREIYNSEDVILELIELDENVLSYYSPTKIGEKPKTIRYQYPDQEYEKLKQGLRKTGIVKMRYPISNSDENYIVSFSD